MIVRKYGITLRRLKEADIELLRQKRNSTAIQNTMFYREEITPEMQKKWFDSINNKNNGYFIIEFEGKKIGLVHGKDIDFEKRTCEGGIFIWDETYIRSFIPSLASVIMNDWTFYMINFKAIYAKIMLDNTIAINYNKLMGYKPCEPLNDDKGVQWMILTKESYEKHMILLRKGIKDITGDGEVLKLENGDASDDLGKEIDLFYKGLPPDIQERGDTLLKWAREKQSKS
ncbi:MAG TPA: GNAT family N-acetyltransferase [Bacteroidia bacterium]|nr:GNAT family N-acetyltransferase [Bacteroidia bacterium]